MEKKRILAVDDDPEILDTLKLMLLNSGYEVVTAPDGLKALELARDKKDSPDLILLDLNMPKLDGYKVCRRLKYANEYKQIPIIMLTGLSESKHKQMGFASEADDYVTKPFDHDDLLKKIEKLLKQEEKQ